MHGILTQYIRETPFSNNHIYTSSINIRTLIPPKEPFPTSDTSITPHNGLLQFQAIPRGTPPSTEKWTRPVLGKEALSPSHRPQPRQIRRRRHPAKPSAYSRRGIQPRPPPHEPRSGEARGRQEGQSQSRWVCHRRFYWSSLLCVWSCA